VTSNPWQELSAAPRNGSCVEVLYGDGYTEKDVYWASERSSGDGPFGPGFMSTEIGLPVDPIKWRPQK